jgi:hypothetical protein
MLIEEDIIKFVRKSIDDPDNKYYIIANQANWINVNNVNEELILRVDEEDYQKVVDIYNNELYSYIVNTLTNKSIERQQKLKDFNNTDRCCNRCNKIYKTDQFRLFPMLSDFTDIKKSCNNCRAKSKKRYRANKAK